MQEKHKDMKKSSFDRNLTLQDETHATIQILRHGTCSLDLTDVNLSLIKSIVHHSLSS
ncbi:hypothetical protein Pint_05438 [Pistacia integerrima]|uniref:Uncharacterized protein n=1 Tax=Pistacia integerrima TaxID=434235 RepID=A0ACC0Z6J0_9ROSI|nr:hypothetical protein Pint_05438 [Pistacia integerrima]